MTDNRVNPRLQHVLSHHPDVAFTAPDIPIFINRKAVSHRADTDNVTLQAAIRWRGSGSRQDRSASSDGRAAKLEQTVHKPLLLRHSRLIIRVLLTQRHCVSPENVRLAYAGRGVLDALRHSNGSGSKQSLKLLKRLVLDVSPFLKALRPRLITECPARNGLLNRARLLITTGLNGAVSGLSIGVCSIAREILS